MTGMYLEFGKWLVNKRQEKGFIKQVKFAEQFMIPQTSLSGWEHGRSLPPIQYWGILCAGLGIKMQELASRVNEAYDQSPQPTTMVAQSK